MPFSAVREGGPVRMTDKERRELVEGPRKKPTPAADTLGKGTGSRAGTAGPKVTGASRNTGKPSAKNTGTKSGKGTDSSVIMKRVIVIAVVAAIIGGFVLYSYFTSKVYKSAPGTVGNTAGNLYNGGLFCENGDRIYFSNPNDDYTLYSMNLQIDDFKKLYDDYARYINVDENYVFYTRMNNKKTNPTQSIFIFYSTGVFRLKKNGGSLQMISPDPCGSLLLYDNRLYYESYKDNALTLHRVDINKENDRKLFSDDTPVASVYGDKLYYSGNLSDQNIHYVNTSGNTAVAVETKAYLPIALDEGIFYISTENDYNIYLVDYEDKERKCIVNRPVTWYNITTDGKYVFYNCDREDENGMYMLDREKNEETKIAEGNFKWINLAGGYCFYFDFFTEKVYAYDYVNKRLNAFIPPVKK